MSEHDFPVEQQPDVVSGRAITTALFVGVAISVLAVVIAGFMLKQQKRSLGVQEHAAQVAPTQIQGIHQTLIERERHGLELRETQQKALDGYGWIDRGRGIARIPIDRAIDLVVKDSEKGAPLP